jgi:ABC-2 type transport system ATP-binding protein
LVTVSESSVMSDGQGPGPEPEPGPTGEASSGDGEPAVQVSNVRKAYGETTALDGVSLSVARGEVVGLLGPNGAGKTTLVRAITGTTEADGDLRVFGRPPRQVDRDRLGVLPQTYEPPERLTARELLAYYGGLYEDAQEPLAVLDAVGVAGAADTRYDRLSGGQQRRVDLAAALVNDPDLLVLDEPTAGIDPAGARAVRDRIAALAAAGTTVLVTGHDIDEIETVADRVALLDRGSLVAAGPPAALVAEHGGPSRLLVEVDAERDAERARTALADYEVTETRRGVVLRDVNRAAIGDVVEAIDGAGVAYTALRWSRPSLEDVYLALTGHADLAGVVGAGDLNRAAAVAQSERRASDGRGEREADEVSGSGSGSESVTPGGESA